MAKRRVSRDRRRKAPRLKVADEAAVSKTLSPTAIAAEALRTGVLPVQRRPDTIPGEGDTIKVGDPDGDSLANEYSGEDTPGGSTPTPDQNDVDEIGRAYGLQEEDSGVLRSGAEVLERRDRHRNELKPPRRPGP
jgi:hypothetical protein